ncbi:MAG: alpha-2-macroglobulin, partial [Treponema sp.]|nr:alpha-2-macroglobulin [Treponema sp.]
KTVDLDPYLEKAGSGQYHGALAFNADVLYEYRYKNWRTEEMVSEISHYKNEQIIQVTDLGMTVRYGYNKAVVLVTSLKTGEPVPNATVSVRKMSWNVSSRDVVLESNADNAIAEGRTDSSGLAVVNLPAGTFASGKNDYIYIQAKTADDSAIFNPTSHNMWASSVDRVSSPGYAEDEEGIVFIFTDRGLYKPGETMTFRIIDRRLKLGEYSPYQGNYTIQLTDGSWDSTVIATKDDRTTANGTGWGQFKIPDDIEPGTYCLKYRRGNVNESLYVQIQFFERLRFEVNSSIADMTYYSGDTLSASIAAQYLGGGSMGDSTYDSYWTRSPQGFRAPGVAFEKYSFGPVQGYDGTTSLDSDSGRLSADGKASVNVKTGGEKLKGMAYRYRMEASVSDSGNQTISSSASAVVHPAKFYLGLSQAKNVSGFPKKGNPLKYDYVCVTPDGSNPESNDLPSNKKMKVELLREEWKEVQQLSWNGELTSRYQRSMITESEQTINLSGTSKATEFSVTPPKGGAYIIRISTEDASGNEIITERHQYVTGSDWTWFSRYNSEEIELTPDKDEYEVGDKAQLLMQSPLPKGRYLITVEREGILSQEVRVINEPTTVLEFDIKENYVPIMYVSVASYSTRTEAPAADYNSVDMGKPKGYFGVTALNVSTETRRFNIEVKTDKALYKPGEKATIKIHASNKNGAVSNAEVTLMAVDRGVIDLINYHVPDPVSYFYDKWYFPICVRGGDSRSLLMDPITYTSNNLVGGDSDEKMQERKNFDPTALFVPALITDKNGDAQYTFTLPDSLTAYRITAVGVSGNNFSLTEDEMSVANPVSVRTVMPRKLRLGDVSEIGATLSNLEGTAHNVTITMNLYSGIEKTGVTQNPYEVQKLPGKASLQDKTTKTISVPAQSTKPLYFTIKGDEPGWITVEYIVKSDVVNEKILMPLEIEKPYIYETVATVGEVGRDEKQASGGEKLILPGDAEDNMGSLYVQLDPTRIGVLGEAVRYVFHYPYGCLEQRSAAILPLVAFGEYIDAFGLNSEVVNAKAVVENEIKNWASSQLSDGSFPYWPGGKYSSLYVSTRIGEILGIAKKKGINITSEIDLDDLADYLKRESYEYLGNNSRYSWYSYDAVHSLYSASMLTSSGG